MGKIIRAIDIGTTKIVALAGELDENGRIRIIAKGTVPTPLKSVQQGVVQNIEVVSKSIRRAVKIAEESSSIKFDSAFIGIAGQHIKSTHNSHSIHIKSEDNIISVEDVLKMASEMKEMAALEANQEIIDVIPQSYSIDTEVGVEYPVGRFGKKLSGNYHIIISDLAGTKNIKRCVQSADVQVNDLFLEPIASSAAVLTEDEKYGGVALVDIGGGTTDLAIFHEGILKHTVVIPFGGNVITDDITYAYKTLPKYAEMLKTKYGDALSEFADNAVVVLPGISGRPSRELNLKALSLVIQSRMEEIIDIIYMEIKRLGYENKLRAGIALTGGGSLLKNLAQLMSYQTGLDVKLSKPHKSVFYNEKDNSPKLSTAVGLVMLGFDNLDKVKKVTKAQNTQKEKAKKEEEIIKRNTFWTRANANIKDRKEKFTQGIIGLFDAEDTEIKDN